MRQGSDARQGAWPPPYVGYASVCRLAYRGRGRVWPGLTRGFFKAAVAEMQRQGFAPDEIVKVGGGDYCRVFGKATSTHA